MKDLIDMSHFDDHGRVIPGDLHGAVQEKTRRYFRCDQPEIDLTRIYENSVRFLDHAPSLSKEEFSTAYHDMVATLKKDPQTENLFKGVHVPFLIPSMSIQDMGIVLENTFISAVQKAFEEQFPDYHFKDHNQKELSERLSIAPHTGHSELVERLAKDDVVGIYFPAMDGYSLQAARERVQTLCDGFSLAGGMDTCAALIACPDLLMRKDGYPPLLWFSALESIDPAENFHFEAYGYDLSFNRRVHLGNADEYWVSGLVFSQNRGA